MLWKWVFPPLIVRGAKVREARGVLTVYPRRIFSPLAALVRSMPSGEKEKRDGFKLDWSK